MKRTEFQLTWKNDDTNEADWEIEYRFNGKTLAVIPLGRLRHLDPIVDQSLRLVAQLNYIQPDEL